MYVHKNNIASVGVAVVVTIVVEVMVVLLLLGVVIAVVVIAVVVAAFAVVVVIVVLGWLFKTAIATVPATHVATKSTNHSIKLYTKYQQIKTLCCVGSPFIDSYKCIVEVMVHLTNPTELWLLLFFFRHIILYECSFE